MQYDYKLMFFPTAEGYVSAVYPEGITGGDPPKFAYVTNIRDHLGNLRMSITRDNNDKVILQERNYYPFGLLHRGYNEEKHEIKYTEAEEDKIFTPQVVAGHYKYWYQEQERQTDLDLNWDSFKYRNYDYAIGRFMSVDPLAEKYPYNGVYNFSENRVIDGRELEGLEVSLTNGNDTISGPLSESTVYDHLNNGYYYTNDSQSSGIPEMDEGSSMFIKLDEVVIDASESNSGSNGINPPLINETTDNGINTGYPNLEPLTDADIQLSNYYTEMHDQAIRFQNIQNNLTIHEPVLSGYYGGANQYPVISGAFYNLYLAPDALAGYAVSYGFEYGVNAYRARRTWSYYKRLRGPGMTLKRKSQLYRATQRRTDAIMNIYNKYKNYQAGYSLYKLSRDSIYR